MFQDEEELIDFEAQEEKNSVTEYSAEKMKQTDQLYLKIASKYMEPNTSQSNNSAMKGKDMDLKKIRSKDNSFLAFHRKRRKHNRLF